MTRLERNVGTLRKLGCRAKRADVVGARIIASPPPRAGQLAIELERYRRRYATPGGRRVALMLRLPSPVSLLLDGIVASVRDLSLPAYRHEVIGTLILEHEPQDGASLVRAFNEYRRMTVGELTTPLLPLAELLVTTRPKQGARSR